MSTSRAKIVRNIFSYFLGTGISILVGFALVPFTIRHIGLVGFGVWALVNGLVGSMGLLDAGLAPTLTKQSAELLANKDEHGLNETASKIFTLYLLAGLAACTLTWSLSVFVSDSFKVPPAEVHIFRSMLLIVGLQLAVSFPLSTWSGLMSGLQDFHIINAIAIGANIAKAILIVALLRSGYGLLSLVWAGFAVAVVGFLVTIVWVKHRLPRLRIRASLRNFVGMTKVLRFSGVMFIWGIAGKILLESDRIIIGLFMPVAAISIYEVGLRMCNYSRNVLYSVFTVLPAASDLSARNEKAKLQQLYLVGTRYLLLAYMFVAAMLLLFGKEFVYLWMGPGFEQSVVIMYILVLGTLYQTQNLVAHVLLPGMDRIRVFTAIMVAYPIVNLVLSIVLVIKLGLPGVALATSITYVVLETCFLFYIIKIFDVSIATLLMKCHYSAIITILPAVVVSYYFKMVINSYSWFGLLTGVAVFTLISGAAFVTYGISKQERKTLRLRTIGFFSNSDAYADELS